MKNIVEKYLFFIFGFMITSLALLGLTALFYYVPVSAMVVSLIITIIVYEKKIKPPVNKGDK